MSFGILRKPAIIISFFFTINPSQNPSYKTIKLPLFSQTNPLKTKNPELYVCYCCSTAALFSQSNVCLFYCTCSSLFSFTNPEQTFACSTVRVHLHCHSQTQKSKVCLFYCVHKRLLVSCICLFYCVRILQNRCLKPKAFACSSSKLTN